MARCRRITLAVIVCFSSAAFGQAKGDSAIPKKLNCGRAVNDVAFSPDGSFLVAACGRWSGWGGIRLWRTRDWAATDLAQGEGDEHFYDRVAISPSGNLVAGVTQPGILRFWRTATGDKLREVGIGNENPESLAFTNEDSVIVLARELLYEVSVKTGTKKIVAKGVRTVGVAARRTEMAVATKKALQLLRLPGYEIEKTLSSDLPFFAKFASDETLLLTGGGGIVGHKSVEIRSLPSGELRHELKQFRAGVFAASISHAGNSVLLAGGSYGSGGDLSAWSLPGGVQTGYRSFGEMPFESVDWAPDDSYFAAGSTDGYVVLYKTADFKGPEVKDQNERMCATVANEKGNRTLRPLAQVPTPNRLPMMWAWGLRVDGSPDWAIDGAAVAVEKWAISRSAVEDTAIVQEAKVVSRSPESIIIGDISNPGWNRGLLIRIYRDDQVIASTNSGTCLTYGRLRDIAPGATFVSLQSQLQAKAFNTIPAEPLTRGVDHFRIKFISEVKDGNSETRSDAPRSKEFDDLYAALLRRLAPIAKLAPPLEMPPIRGLAVPK